MSNQPTIYTLTLTSTIGCYYVEPATSESWTTFTMFNHTVPCSDCGADIGSGYQRGGMDDATYHCVEHVQVS